MLTISKNQTQAYIPPYFDQGDIKEKEKQLPKSTLIW